MFPPFDPWLSGAVAADVAVASHSDAQALANRQARRLADLLETASRESPLYRRMLRGLNPSTLRLSQLPIVRKAELMHRFDDWVCDREVRIDALRRFTADPAQIAQPFLGRYVVWESSGSGGEPGIFVQDAAAMAVYDALEALRRPVLRPSARLLDPWGLRDRIAFVGAVGGHFASTVSIERLRRLNPMLSRGMHSVSFLQPLDRLVAELRALAPTIVATYPSAAMLLAEERLAGRLPITLQEVWTGGETLSPAMRRFVEGAFGCRVANSYGASEFLSLAFDCALGGLHLNSDWVILESVDDRGQASPPDEAGTTTLLTNLANHLQPLIRYDLGDRVTLRAQRCACGSSLPLIEVQGRSDDTLSLGAPGTSPVRILPLALSTVLEEGVGLFDFQLEQTGPCELLLRTGLCGPQARSTLRRARSALAAFLESQGTRDVRIRCRAGEPSRRNQAGKIQRVVALCR